jgi:hypothetical protein
MTHGKLEKIKHEFLNITKMAMNDNNIHIPKSERLLHAYKAVEINEKKALGQQTIFLEEYALIQDNGQQMRPLWKKVILGKLEKLNCQISSEKYDEVEWKDALTERQMICNLDYLQIAILQLDIAEQKVFMNAIYKELNVLAEKTEKDLDFKCQSIKLMNKNDRL